MILGSHNTLSYLKPTKWWMRPFRFMAQCQSLPLKQQWEVGCRVFDIRLIFDKKDGSPRAAHGLMEFGDENTIYTALCFLNCRAKETGEKVYVRLLNERDENYDRFIGFCETLCFPNLIFFGCNNKKTWERLYNFNEIEPNLVDKYASMNHDECHEDESGWHHEDCNGTIWDDIFPRIYAKFNNKKWREHYKDVDVYLLQDFVGKY